MEGKSGWNHEIPAGFLLPEQKNGGWQQLFCRHLHFSDICLRETSDNLYILGSCEESAFMLCFCMLDGMRYDHE